MATCGNSLFPITLDTGASVTILSKEVVDTADLMSITIQARSANDTCMPLEEAKVCLSIGKMELSSRVGVAPSSLIGATGLLSFNFEDEYEWQQLAVLRQQKHEATVPVESESSFSIPISPTTIKFKGYVSGSELSSFSGVNVVASSGDGTSSSSVVSENIEDFGQGLSKLFEEPSNVSVAPVIEDVPMLDSSVGSGSVPGEQDEDCIPVYLVVEKEMVLDTPRESEDIMELRKQVLENHSLKFVRHLATKKLNGYLWEDGIVLHVRHNVEGKVIRQICPLEARSGQVMNLTYNKFGHLSKSKLAAHIQKFFLLAHLVERCREPL